MYDDGFINITSIDYSPVVIEKMKQKSQDRPGMKWEVMDMMDLTFDEGSFDCVLDKAAMDALMCEEGDPWNPNSEVVTSVSR
eukprot:CAMPEP_0113948818 /NCGR_PEP_ID=MMETSP1339-20121228/72183_1 /TAXON_ID=94617 /ORGANISM="Fibrocapsa japonica" /LENGTH=81 /DNA_ID=CAMNT_0000955999 /DNA_START=79 /DNA_END=320 /DNA_ORIENTATION=+ /assembly_acc=CAM_ASM_000762